MSVLPASLPSLFRATPSFTDNLEISQAIVAVRHARGGDAVAYQQNRVESLGADQDLNRRSGDVHTIGDHFGGHFGIGEDRADHAGIAVLERAHRVVHVNRVARPGVDRRARLIVIGVGVADRRDDLRRDRRGDQFERAGKFGRERDNLHQPVRGLDEFARRISTDGFASESGG